MPRIYYFPDRREVEVDERTRILNASQLNNIPHIHVCGGNARCSTCRVMVMEGLENCLPRNERETALAERLCFSADIRLACQTGVTGDVVVRRLVLDQEDIEVDEQPREGVRYGQVGDERKIAILFADIRNFTTLTEAMLPYDVIHILNRYFYTMDHIIERNDGYVDNHMGDGIMALFGTENTQKVALKAVKAGLEMLEAANQLRPYIEKLYTWDFQIGIGIHYGEAVVGALGAINKKYTAIGDAVNFASRVESANKDSGTNLLISGDTYAEVQNFVVCNRRFELMLKGKQGVHALYEVIGLK
jgi:adenylate cyclase